MQKCSKLLPQDEARVKEALMGSSILDEAAVKLNVSPTALYYFMQHRGIKSDEFLGVNCPERLPRSSGIKGDLEKLQELRVQIDDRIARQRLHYYRLLETWGVDFTQDDLRS